MSDVPSFRSFPPDKAAIIMASDGRVVRFGELETAANRGAQVLRALGLHTGDKLAICIANSPEFFHVACAARRSGLTVVPISTRLTAGELAFIVGDSGARALILSPGIEASPDDVAALCDDVPILRAGAGGGAGSWEAACAAQPDTPIADEARGREMLYSSGTTGRPKGIVYEDYSDGPQGRDATSSARRMFDRLGVDDSAVYLSPAPLYHSAPFAWAIGIIELGGTTIVMEHFDAEQALALIDTHHITVTQWVPTHFVRMLKLPDAVRRRYDMSSLRIAIHAAAPCPVPVKQAMIEWWGPILLEYFGSSEQTALTFITSEEWLTHPGSVGRCVLGKLHICDERGRPLPQGEVGVIYSEGGTPFSYHNDAAKTAESRSAEGWTTVGDIGRLDEDGYLYLTDRKSFMIITGGVNVYPQEIENRLITHPGVADAAVIGAPDEDLGEVVTAVVQSADPADAEPGLCRRTAELDASGTLGRESAEAYPLSPRPAAPANRQDGEAQAARRDRRRFRCLGRVP
ncbi:AMP-binding protein [Sphingopyxis sp. PET50]|uniref:AMP-binding protein n=1 Tax=Sphingopyxis sp. PET50 TaxID=2976533 RepID=UPI0028ABFC82|nr:AMP-binding protein [Sphingopyxis sp. PET50]